MDYLSTAILDAKAARAALLAATHYAHPDEPEIGTKWHLRVKAMCGHLVSVDSLTYLPTCAGCLAVLAERERVADEMK